MSCELDTHADTCCFGRNCYIMSSDLNETAEVTPFADGLGKLSQVPIVTVAVAYDCPKTYQTFILIFNKSLYIKQLNHHLLCPNQMRLSGTIVNDCPLQFTAIEDRSVYTHTVVNGSCIIPLKLKGVLSYFDTRMPTDEEISNPDLYTHIEMTSQADWDPYDDKYCEDETYIRKVNPDEIIYNNKRIISEISISLSAISDALDEESMLKKLKTNINCNFNVSAVVSAKKGTVSAIDLAKRWFIGVETAKRTIDSTTQRGVRDFTSSSGTKRLKSTAYQLRYRHLRATVYTDTLITTVKSLYNQYTCAQIYITSFHWMKVYPMKEKSDAHLTLDALHRDVGVFHTIIPDNAKELVQGEFRRKALQAGASIRPIEPYMHNQNLAESGIRELR